MSKETRKPNAKRRPCEAPPKSPMLLLVEEIQKKDAHQSKPSNEDLVHSAQAFLAEIGGRSSLR